MSTRQPTRVILLLVTLSVDKLGYYWKVITTLLHRKVYAPNFLPWCHPNTDNWLITTERLTHPFKFLYSAVYFSRHLWHHPYITSLGSPAWKTHILTLHSLKCSSWSSRTLGYYNFCQPQTLPWQTDTPSVPLISLISLSPSKNQ